MKKFFLIFSCVAFVLFRAVGQLENEPVVTFDETRVVNGHSPEILPHRVMDFRVSHKFGDMGGENGGASALWGLDNASDIRIALEYGLTEKLTVGFGRSKGSGPWKQVFDMLAKYKLLTQGVNNKKISVALLEIANFTTMPASDNPSDATSFYKFAHRVNYITQIVFARKINDKISLQLVPTFVHRNYTAYHEQSGLFYLGAAGRYKISKVFGILLEYFPQLNKNGNAENRNAYGCGIEINSGRHVFTVNITNSRALSEGQFLASTTAEAYKGELRLGFTITRPFKL